MSAPPSVPRAPADDAPRERIGSGGRYEVLRRIGRGGMAEVFEVIDSASEQRLALKQLQPETESSWRKRVTMLEREYHTLAQLAHPRVVEVYEYGVGDAGPYYTMELLDGGDLHKLAPIDWKRAASLFRDVCSAVALLHSRRFVHRDLSTRNIRCTSDGRAKLLDFGAMMPMGPTRDVVGSPPFVAPEVLNLQSLDARADLFSLGAALYYVLTGRHAYPAKDFSKLPALWAAELMPPSAWIEGLPPALQELVMDLLRTDRELRPASASEVMDRLGAIAGLRPDEQLRVSRSYLINPTLVGRNSAHERLSRLIGRASKKGSGATAVIAGAPGVGRTRMLDAVVLAARLTGAMVLRADAQDASHGDYGTARALLRRLIQQRPGIRIAPDEAATDLLGRVLPELARDERAPEEAGIEQLRPRIQAALVGCFREASRDRCVVIAVDDLARVDEPSAALLALLAHETQEHPIVVAGTLDTSVEAIAPGAIRALVQSGVRIGLDGLSQRDTERLLKSVFGEVQHLDNLAQRLHMVTGGNPRDIMNLAQHLVESDVIRYEDGAWTLPETIGADALPSTFVDTLVARTDKLSKDARFLAECIALSSLPALALTDCRRVSGIGSAGRLLASLDELLSAEILRAEGDLYGLAHPTWNQVLDMRLSEARRREIHARLAALFQAREKDAFRFAQHVRHAGEEDRALDLLIRHSEESTRLTDERPDAFSKFAKSLPADWRETYGWAIDRCRRTGRSRRDRFVLETRLAGLVMSGQIRDMDGVLWLAGELAREVGLDLYAEADPSLAPQARIMAMFQAAGARHAARPEADRLFTPTEAIKPLARCIVVGAGLAGMLHDYPAWRSLPNMGPILALAPTLPVVRDVARGVGLRLSGRYAEMRRAYRRVLDRLAEPDKAGLAPTYALETERGVTARLALVDATLGLESTFHWAARLTSESLYEVNGTLAQMVYRYFQGEAKEGDELRQRAALLNFQNGSLSWGAGVELFSVAHAHSVAGDVTRLRRTIEELDVVAQRGNGWKPILEWAHAEYRRIRGDLDGAFERVVAVLDAVGAGEHEVWALAATSHLELLLARGQLDAARAAGEKYVNAAAAAELEFESSALRAAFAVALAKTGDGAAAVSEADRVIAELTELGASGFALALPYEARALVALESEGPDAFQKYAGLAATHLNARNTRAGSRRYERLRNAAQAMTAKTQFTGFDLTFRSQELRTQVSEELLRCQTVADRAARSLELLLSACDATGGFLYRVRETGPERAACLGVSAETDWPDDVARAFVEAEVLMGNDSTMTTDDTAFETIPRPSDRGYWPVTLGHQSQDGYHVTGLALLLREPTALFAPPFAMASAISACASEAGDTGVLVVSEESVSA